ncbi:MAG: FAD:protein FMN transferase [Verrucomicrobiota bacterium]
METLKAACNAMATRFELVLHGESVISLRAAAEEAIHEIERLHAQLSLYSPASEVSSINARAARQAVPVEPRLFALLQRAQQIHRATEGAFDITVAPLIRCWGFMGGGGALPTPAQLAEARAKVGMDRIILDEGRSTIRFASEGMMIDLGSIGKGYALEVAAETLAEAGVQNALLHGGTSTVCAMGTPVGAETWKVAIDAPPRIRPDETVPSEPNRPLAIVALKDEALSVSGVHGKCFSSDGKIYGHVIDPRTGIPTQSALLAAVALPSPTETDAYSTALLIGGMPQHTRIAGLRAGMRTLVVGEKSGRFIVAGTGIPFTA